MNRRGLSKAVALMAMLALTLVGPGLVSEVDAGAAPPTTPVGQSGSVPPGSTDLGPSSGSTPLLLDVVLASQDPQALAAFVEEVSTPGSAQYHRYLAKGQFGPRFGASQSTIEEVSVNLSSEGLHPGAVSANDLIIPVQTTVAGAGAAFHVSIHDYRLPSGRVAHANTAPPQISSSIAAAVVDISGLSTTEELQPSAIRASTAAEQNRLVPHVTNPTPCSSASNVTGSYTANQLAQAYGFDVGAYGQSLFGTGQTVALFELEPFSSTDVGTYQTCFGISTNNAMVNVTTTSVDGGAGSGPGSGESALDIEDVTGLAPAASIDVYEAPNTNAGSLDEYTRIANDDSAQTISTSWGLCESLAGRSVAQSEETVFEQMAAQGQTLVAASGDGGSEDCSSKSTAPLAVDDPASDPYVTGVGGTTLTSLGPPPSETVWNHGGSGAGGGGISSFWAMPSWQTALGVNAHSSGTPCSAAAGSDCREVPDVSASADPFDGYTIRWNGGWIAIGGTSAGAPLWGSLVALADEGCGGRAGFLNPGLYGHASDLNDITSGNNDFTGHNGGLYPAGVGYDMASGLGTPTSGLFSSGVLCGAGLPTKLAITTEPAASVSAGSTVSLSAAVEDQNGNVVTGGTGSSDTIGVALSSGSFASGATSVAASGGVASFSGLAITKAGTVTITASDTSRGAVTSAVTTSVSVTAGPAVALAFSAQPSGSSAGVAFPAQPQVSIEDQYANVVTTNASTVTLAIVGGTPASGGPGTLSGCTPSESQGVVTFSGCSIDTAGTAYQLRATDGTLTAAASNPFDITPGSLARFSVSAPAAATAGIGFGVTVTAQDSGGNTVSSYAGTECLTFSGPANSPSGATPSYPPRGSCPSGSSITFVGGVATPSITLVDAQSTHLGVSGSGVSGTSAGITVTAGPVAKVAVTTEPAASISAGGTVSLSAAVEDQYGNVVTSGTGSSDTIGVALSSGTFASGATSSAASGGVASFSGLAITSVGTFTITASDTSRGAVTSATTTSVTVTATAPPPPAPAPKSGYWLVGSDGGVFGFGDAGYVGSLPGIGVHVSNIVAMVPTADGRGYWMVGSDGGVFGFGDAGYVGSLPGIGVHVSNIVAMVPTADGRGYWMVGSDGGVFGFGDAGYVGSLPGIGVHVSNIVAMVPTADGRGYWMVGSDGGVFGFGDAGYVGSLPGIGVHVSNIVAMVPTADGRGYWMVGSDGGVFGFGDAGYVGSLPGIGVHVSNIVAMVPTADGRGYWMVGSDGGVFGFGDAGYVGSLPGIGVHVSNIVAMVAVR